jgi:hypothetical protein
MDSSCTAILWILLGFARVILVPLFECLFLSFFDALYLQIFSVEPLQKSPICEAASVDMYFVVSYTSVFLYIISITCLACQPALFSDNSCLIFIIFFCGISGGGLPHFLVGLLILLVHVYQIGITICKPPTTLICVILFLLLWVLPDHQF